MKYLSTDGLSHLWSIIKQYVATAVGNAKTEVGNYTVNGKKLSTNPTLAKGDVGLGSVDNTADASKPVSTPQKTYIDTQVSSRIATSEKGKANGVATLGSDSKLTAAQLPALKTVNGTSIVGSGDIAIDLSLYKVVTELPSTGIDANKIYLILSSTKGTQNKYKEYVYTADPAAAYDASKWEELGTYSASVDLTPYVKFTDLATAEKAGAMSAEDKQTLDALATLPGVLVVELGDAIPKADHMEIPVMFVHHGTNEFERDETMVSLPSVTATEAGVMTAADKSKIDTIAAGATADSAMTNAEIDTICV